MTRERYLEALRGRGLEPLAISAEREEGLEALTAVLTRRLEEMGLLRIEGAAPAAADTTTEPEAQ